jgi:hypothetical protein
MEASERLARLRVGMAGVALANLVLGLAAETAGKEALRSLGFDALSAFVWGLLYAAMAAMVR